jgi:hypothetical protein
MSEITESNLMLASSSVFCTRWMWLAAVSQDVPHRLPIDAGRLHCHMRALIRRQPVAQTDQACCRRLEGADLGGDFVTFRNAQAGNDRKFVHVKGATAWI